MSEVALGFVLLVGAGLMIRTMAELHKVDPGFNADGTLTFELNLAGGNYATSPQRTGFIERWEEKLSSLPGVESVGAVSHLPLDDYPNWYSSYAPEGVTEEQKRNLLADHRTVTPGYFQAIGAQLIAGRLFDKQDNQSSRNVVIVDDLLARQTWPGENAIGKKIQAESYVDGGFASRWAEVVGVVKHIRHHSLSKELRGQIYIPFYQSSWIHQSYVVRAQGDPLALASVIRQELRALDQNLAFSKVHPLDWYVSKDLASANFTALLASLFSGLALALAAVGIYGVISYSVSQRTQEIGIRMTLGARPGDVLRLILRQGLISTLIGIAVGLGASVGLTRLLSSLLFSVSATDPLTFLAVPVLLIFVALVACYVPARRAMRVDPMVALRSE